MSRASRYLYLNTHVSPPLSPSPKSPSIPFSVGCALMQSPVTRAGFRSPLATSPTASASGRQGSKSFSFPSRFDHSHSRDRSNTTITTFAPAASLFPPSPRDISADHVDISIDLCQFCDGLLEPDSLHGPHRLSCPRYNSDYRPRVGGWMGTDTRIPEAVSFLAQGATFIKHGRHGRPHPRTVKIDPQTKILSYESNSLSMNTVVDVLIGKQTQVMRSTDGSVCGGAAMGTVVDRGHSSCPLRFCCIWHVAFTYLPQF
jgi:hypothetical protein